MAQSGIGLLLCREYYVNTVVRQMKSGFPPFRHGVRGCGSKIWVRVAVPSRRTTVRQFFQTLQDEQGQDIAEYAVMLAVILVIVIRTCA